MDEVIRLRLECVEGNARGTEIPVDSELMIGRHAEQPGDLAGDGELSRQHVRIHRAGDTYVIDDLVSTNGTFVNGVRIAGTQLLADGDRIELGATTLVAHLQRTAAERPSVLARRLEVDFEAREVVVALGDDPPLRLVGTADGWRQS